MLSTHQGSVNGIVVNTYYKDTVYDIPKDLRDSFIKAKFCIDIVEEEITPVEEKKQKKQEPVIEEKAIDEAPENKAIDTKKISRKKVTE